MRLFKTRKQRQLVYLIENAEWAIKWVGYYITRNLPSSLSPLTAITDKRMKKKILHYGSANLFFWEDGYKIPPTSNRVVVTWFHVTSGDRRLEHIPLAMKHIDILHTSCTITANVLIEHGAMKEKTTVIPLGVDTERFKPPSEQEYDNIRNRLGIPKDSICIGSFQKDGVGWGEGFEPKMIKGPDILCDVLEQLNKEFPIYVLLTGPARGYVKDRLQKSSIPFTHHYLKSYLDIVDYYKALDLYIVSSRAEGGPMTILEAMACGVPLVTTNVGMVPDIILDSINGFVAKGNDIVNKLVDISRKVITDVDKEEYSKRAALDVKKYDWKKIAARYYNEIYSKLKG